MRSSVTFLLVTLAFYQTCRVAGVMYGANGVWSNVRSYSMSSAQIQASYTAASTFSYGGLSVTTLQTFGSLGCVAFNQFSPSEPQTPLPYTGTTDPAMICPYMAYMKNFGAGTGNLMIGTSDATKGPDVLNEMAQDIQSSSAGLFTSTVQLRSAQLFTWMNVSSVCNPTCATQPTQTFQLVFAYATNGDAFAIMNYDNLLWDGSDGMPGSYAQAGLNLGAGRGWIALPFSGKAQVTKLSSYSSVAQKPGRYVFRISGNPRRLGCLSLSSTDLATAGNQPLSLATATGTVLGGERVLLQGPCLSNVDQSKLFCGFQLPSGSWSTAPATAVSGNTAACKQPQVPNIDLGATTVGLSTDGGNTFSFTAPYYVSVPAPALYPVSISNRSALYGLSVQSPVNISWDATKFGGNQSVASSIPVEIWVVGYSQSKGVAVASDLALVGTATSTDGMFLIGTQVACTVAACANTVIGQIQVRVPTASVSSVSGGFYVLSSGFIPLGWFTNQASTNAAGSGWYGNLCPSAAATASVVSPVASSVGFVCPCNVSQVATQSRLFQLEADPECDSQGCTFNSAGSSSCYLSTPGAGGIGLRCCYDWSGSLIYTQDRPLAGSYAIRFPPSSSVVSTGASGASPLLSYYLNDVANYLTCCAYGSAAGSGISTRCYSLANSNTIPQNCAAYQPDGIAAIAGDPHFITPDATQFTSNGVDNFWYVSPATSQFGNFRAQVLLDIASSTTDANIEDTDLQFSATVLRGVAVAFENSPVVDVQVNFDAWRTARNLRVLVGGTEALFANSLSQQYRNVRIISDSVQNTVRVIGMDASITCQYVSDSIVKNSMQCTFSISADFKGIVKGLVGNWDGNPQNDLTSNQGTVVTASDMASVLNVFGASWQVTTAGNSMFTYLSDQTFSPGSSGGAFVPPLVMSPQSITNRTDSQINQICGVDSGAAAHSAQCAFDLRVTDSATFAVNTQTYLVAVDQLQAKANASASVSAGQCPLLNVPYSVKSSTIYSIGSSVTVSGCVSGYSFIASPTTYTCMKTTASGYWQPSPNSNSCSFATPTAMGTVELVLVIVLPILFLLLVGGGVAYYFLVYKKKSKMEEAESMDNDSIKKRRPSDTPPHRTPPSSELEQDSAIGSRRPSIPQRDEPSPKLELRAEIAIDTGIVEPRQSSRRNDRTDAPNGQRKSPNSSRKKPQTERQSSTSSVDSINFTSFRKASAKPAIEATYIPMSSTASKLVDDEEHQKKPIDRVSVEMDDDSDDSKKTPPPPPPKPANRKRSGGVLVLPPITPHNHGTEA